MMAQGFEKLKLTRILIPDDDSLDFGDEDFSWFMWLRSQENTDNEWLQKGLPERDDTNYNLRNEDNMVSGVSASDGVPGNETVSNAGLIPSIDDWVNAGGDYRASDNTINVFVNGSNPSRKTVNNVPVLNADDLNLGKLDTIGTEGEMAWVCIWRKKISQNKKEAMKKGINPFVIDPDEKELYMPLWGYGGGRICIWGKDKDQCIEDFSTYTTIGEAEACWVGNQNSNYFVALGANNLDCTILSDSNNQDTGVTHGISFDLGFVLSIRHVLRAKFTWTFSQAEPHNFHYNGGYFGISYNSIGPDIFGTHQGMNTTFYGTEDDRSYGFMTDQFWLTAGSQRDTWGSFSHFRNGKKTRRVTISIVPFPGQNGHPPVTYTRWVELKRIGNEAVEVRIFDKVGFNEVDKIYGQRWEDHFSMNNTFIDGAVSELGDLRFVKVSNQGQQGGGFKEPLNRIRWDDIELWDGISDVPSTGNENKEPDWGRKRNHGSPINTLKPDANPPVNLIQNYLS